MAKRPSAEMYYWLGDTLELRGSHQDAEITLTRGLELNRATSDAEQRARLLRDLVSAAEGLSKPADVEKWFSSLTQTGQATRWDWMFRARSLDSAGRFVEAGESWQKAAECDLVDFDWTDWCRAANSLGGAPGKEDSTLFTARKCISLGAGRPQSESWQSDAHRIVAAVLNDRGVYEEALRHATEAATLNSEDAWAYDQQSVALSGLHRYQEAINAAKQAIRLSDGKYPHMHFTLGGAYFETENWQFAQQSYEKAAELNPASDAAAYNVALCFQHLHMYLDAARWFEESLRRNPNNPNKQDILNSISALRKR